MRTLRCEHAGSARIVRVKPAALGLLVLGLVLAAIAAALALGDGPANVVLVVGAGLCAVGVGCAAALRRAGTPDCHAWSMLVVLRT